MAERFVVVMYWRELRTCRQPSSGDDLGHDEELKKSVQYYYNGRELGKYVVLELYYVQTSTVN